MNPLLAFSEEFCSAITVSFCCIISFCHIKINPKVYRCSDGGAEIFNYVIEFRVEGTTKWTRYGSEQDKVPTTSHTLTQQLEEDTFYEFRVAAENKAGVGPYSDISERVKTLIGERVNLCIHHSKQRKQINKKRKRKQ